MTPTTEQLKQFLAGLLPAVEAAQVAVWIEADPAAAEILGRLESSLNLAAALKATPADEAALPAPVQPEATGTLIAGRYKLLQQIGEGGMGTVWMADQTEPVKRRVAVKLIRTGHASSASILSRFEAERQAVALMDHPHVAKLLDAGATADGAPFFVMELVKGVPLTEYCDSNRLSIQERLNLFMQICAGVQHAHQKGIIHRDLKPTNILVESHDGKPVPKVIDFGLAKATTGLQLTEHTLFTAFGTVLGTPLYMAPEQAKLNAVDVDTRADIYALGVILYELLTGSTPITRETVKKVAMEEMIRLIHEQETPTPSSRISSSEAKPSIAANRQTEPAKLGRFVKGELDWIVLKALAKERDRRYETAAAFAKDVERFLNDEPVTAGPPSTIYRLKKFVRRNRPQLIAAAAVVLLAAGGATFAWWKDRMETERVEAGLKQQIEDERAAAAARQRATGNRAVIEDVLSRCEQALDQGDTRLALLAFDQVASRIGDPGGEDFATRYERCRTDVTLLRDLDRIDEMFWSVVEGKYRNGPGAAREWPIAFARFGVEPGKIMASEAARLVFSSRVRERAVRSLDQWLTWDKSKGLAEILKEVDPDPFRNAVRDAVRRGDKTSLATLTADPRALEQSDRFVVVLCNVTASPERREAILLASHTRQPDSFLILFELSSPPPGDGAVKGSGRVRWSQAAVALRPQNAVAWDNLGLALTSESDSRSAEVAFRHATRLQPDVALLHIHLGNALLAQTDPKDKQDEHGKRRAAILAYEKAASLDSADALSQFCLGQVYEELEDWERATAYFKKSVELNPKFPLPQAGLKRIGSKMRD